MPIIGQPRRKVPEGLVLGCEDYEEMIGPVRVDGLSDLIRRGGVGELGVDGRTAAAQKWLSGDLSVMGKEDPRNKQKDFILHDQKTDEWYRLGQVFLRTDAVLVVNGVEKTHQPDWWQYPDE